MNPFTVGDKVICIDNEFISDLLHLGTTSTVLRTMGHLIEILNDAGFNDFYFASRFLAATVRERPTTIRSAWNNTETKKR